MSAIGDSGEDRCHIGLLPSEGIGLPIVNTVGEPLSIIKVRVKVHDASCCVFVMPNE